MDFDLNNYNLHELLELFKLDYNFTVIELKKAKKIVLQTHPDKSGLDKKYFLFFSSAYKVLHSIHEFRTKSNTNQSNKYVIEKDEEKELLIKKIANKSNFNKIFNEFFEKNIIKEESIEKGYGDWLKSEDDIDNSTTTIADMNKTFEDKKTKIRTLIKNEDIKECGGKELYELTGDAPENYGSSLFSKFQFEDVKKAHIESVIPVSNDDLKQHQLFKNEQTLRDYRDSQNTTPMSLKQSNQYLTNIEEQKNKVNMQRAFKLAKQDENNRKIEQKWMSKFKQLTN